MKKAIVSGATGFIGKGLVNALIKRDYVVTAILAEVDTFDEIVKLPNVEVVYCDLSHFCRLPELVKLRGFDTFYHLAWIGSYGHQRSEWEVQLRNVHYACDAMTASISLKCKRFVFASSIMEYEVTKLMQVRKKPPLSTIYGTAKMAAHYMTKAIAASSSTVFNAAILSNVYGEGEISPRFIKSTIMKMLEGSRVGFSQGDQLYDFIYLVDAVEALIAVGEGGQPQKDYYIGNDAPRPLKEFILEIRDIVAPGVEIGLGDIAFNGVSLNYTEFDTKAVQEDFGIAPSTPFKEGIRRTAEWLMLQRGEN